MTYCSSSAVAVRPEAGAVGIADTRGDPVADTNWAGIHPRSPVDRHCGCPFVDASAFVACSEGGAHGLARFDSDMKERMRVADKMMTLPPRLTERLPNVGRD